MSNLEQTLWETPVNSFKSPRLEYLMDSKELEIVIQDAFTRERVQFIFQGRYAYRSCDESFLSHIWNTFKLAGHTVTLNNSDFREYVCADGCYEAMHGKPTQYFITTEDDCIDVVTNKDPIVNILDRASDTSPMPGKSTIIHISRPKLKSTAWTLAACTLLTVLIKKLIFAEQSYDSLLSAFGIYVFIFGTLLLILNEIRKKLNF